MEVLQGKLTRALALAEDAQGGLSSLGGAGGGGMSLSGSGGGSSVAALAAAYGVSLPPSVLRTPSSFTSPGTGTADGDDSASSASTTGASIIESLISHIASLQADMQSKRDSWAAARAALQARVAAAEAAVESADTAARGAEHAATAATQAAATLRSELITMRGSKARADAELALTADRLQEAEGRLQQLTAAHDALQKQCSDLSIANAELRSRADEHAGARSAASHMTSVLRDQLQAAQEEVVALKREVAGLKRQLGTGTGMLSPSGTSLSGGDGTPTGSLLQQFDATTGTGEWDASASASGAGVTPTGVRGSLFSGLEREREMLTQQVLALRADLAAAGDARALLAASQARVAELQAQSDLLLELLGEREEELEALRAEFDDVRETFRIQVDALMRQVVDRDRDREGEAAADVASGGQSSAAAVGTPGAEVLAVGSLSGTA